MSFHVLYFLTQSDVTPKRCGIQGSPARIEHAIAVMCERLTAQQGLGHPRRTKKKKPSDLSTGNNQGDTFPSRIFHRIEHRNARAFSVKRKGIRRERYEGI